MHVEAEREEESHGERNADDIVYARPDEIPLDHCENAVRKAESGNDIEEVRSHQNDICCFDSYRGARGKRNSNGGRDKRRRIVDPITNLSKD